MAEEKIAMSERYRRMLEARKPLKKVFGKLELAATPIFENPLSYKLEDILELEDQHYRITYRYKVEELAEPIARYEKTLAAIKPVENAPKPIYLWPEGKMPQLTEYTDNSEYLYNHDPDFVPYMHEMLLDEDVEPKGAVILCGGGDHGWCTVADTFQSARDFHEMGYQCFMLYNRVNHNPWCEVDSGADVARAIRYIRANAEKYRIKAEHIAYAGFSNGALTGENCIRYFSGEQKMTDHYPDYQPDVLDAYYGAPDAFICVYGPRFGGADFDYSVVKYPPTFYAVGREDFALQNLYTLIPEQIAHGVDIEIHTFAGVPHGHAGNKLVVGKVDYPNFELWLPLADAFLQDLFQKK